MSTLGFGGSLQPPLAVLRGTVFCGAILFLRKLRGPISLPPYFLLVGGFSALALGHAFSSVYVWVSLQHAVNILLASLLLAWAFLLYREDPEAGWERTFPVVAGIAAAEVGVALYQRFIEGDPRPHGTFDNPNFLSEFLVAVSILCLSRLLGRKDRPPLRLAETAGVVVFLASALSLTGSRGVLLAAVPAFGFLLAWRYGVRKGGLLLALLGAPALAVLGWGSVGRFFSPDVYHYGRWNMWKSALRTFLDHPFGVGLGGYKYFWYATQSPVDQAFRRYGKFAHTAHNEYLEVLSGLGVLGFLLFLAVLLVPLLLAARGWKEIPGERRWIAAGAASCLILSGVHALFDFNLHEFGIVFLDAMMLGALLSCLPGAGGRPFRFPVWGARLSVAAAGVLLLVSAMTVAGSEMYERGEKRLKEGDLAGAETAFRTAAAVDPLRSSYPDALSSLSYRRYQDMRKGGGESRDRLGYLMESIRREDRARELNPRETKYVQRLSFLFLDLFRLRGEPSDLRMALGLTDEAMRLNPYGVETLWLRSEIFLSIGRAGEAGSELERAVAVEPNFCRGYARLAELARPGNPREADGWSEKAVQCRKKADGLDLVDYEKWLVESPERR